MERCLYTYKGWMVLGLMDLSMGLGLTTYVSFQKLYNELTADIYGSDRHFCVPNMATIAERPTKVTDDSKWDEMDGNAISNLHLALTDEVLSCIEEKKNANDIWDHLARLYEAR
ncbi:hypothetical protein Tco_0214142 [Tanacetum coccineum]